LSSRIMGCGTALVLGDAAFFAGALVGGFRDGFLFFRFRFLGSHI